MKAFSAVLFFLLIFSGDFRLYAVSVETSERTVLRICADPNNLPLSNQKKEGFENKIADLIGEELNLPVEYFWFPQGMGFVRKTLREFNCDLITGISLTNELLQNTNPYFESTYIMVFRKDAKIKPKSIKDPVIKDLKKGIIARTPPVTALVLNDNLKNFKSFRLMVDTRKFNPNLDMVNELLAGELDVIFMWGPIGGYYVKQHSDVLEYVRLNSKDYGVKMDFKITMGVRRGEKLWKQQINKILKKNSEEIKKILISYGVPLLEN